MNKKGIIPLTIASALFFLILISLLLILYFSIPETILFNNFLEVGSWVPSTSMYNGYELTIPLSFGISDDFDGGKVLNRPYNNYKTDFDKSLCSTLNLGWAEPSISTQYCANTGGLGSFKYNGSLNCIAPEISGIQSYANFKPELNFDGERIWFFSGGTKSATCKGSLIIYINERILPIPPVVEIPIIQPIVEENQTTLEKVYQPIKELIIPQKDKQNNLYIWIGLILIIIFIMLIIYLIKRR